MATTITNTLAASALKGQNVVVTCSAADAAKLPNLTVGQTCTISGNTGRVGELFFGGTTFLIAPNNQATRFDSSSTPGLLASGTAITIS